MLELNAIPMVDDDSIPSYRLRSIRESIIGERVKFTGYIVDITIHDYNFPLVKGSEFSVRLDQKRKEDPTRYDHLPWRPFVRFGVREWADIFEDMELMKGEKVVVEGKCESMLLDDTPRIIGSSIRREGDPSPRVPSIPSSAKTRNWVDVVVKFFTDKGD